MKTNMEHNRYRRRIFVSACIFLIFCTLVFYVLFHDKNTWKEDVDGDDVDEIVKELHLPDGSLERWVIEEDGTLYMTEYFRDGRIKGKWKYEPNPNNKGEYIIYIWDEEIDQWLLDQDQNGVPDIYEETCMKNQNCWIKKRDEIH